MRKWKEELRALLAERGPMGFVDILTALGIKRDEYGQWATRAWRQRAKVEAILGQVASRSHDGTWSLK